TTMISSCGQLGLVEEAKQLFDQMPEPNTVTWNSLIHTYAVTGHLSKAQSMFDRMPERNPDEYSFINVLTACSCSGSLFQARDFFVSMQGDHGLQPSQHHFASMLDLLGRLGQVRDAEKILGEMPCEADSVTWATLLAASRIHKANESGARAARNALELETIKPGAYLLVAELAAK
ncbi:hypothetical protein SELMODRAFT_72213, partial [Selaginella moellendorffii]